MSSSNRRVDDDRLLITQIVEQERQMLKDQAVAMYLERTSTPLDDFSFYNLVRQGLVDQDVLELIEQLDRTALAAAAMSPIPSPALPTPSPAQRTDSSSFSLFAEQQNDKGKRTQLDEYDEPSKPLFATNTYQVNSDPQFLGAISQNSITVFLQMPTTQAQLSSSPEPPKITSNCGICFETFQVVGAPREAASLASSVSKAGKGKAVATTTDEGAASEYGVVLPCSEEHGFCIDCLTMYIKSKLQTGISLEGKGFPVRCPGCNGKTSEWEVDDNLAERVLDEETLEFWRRQKLLLSLPGMIYCPNDRCSELLAPPEEPETDIPTAAECPSCTCSLCFKCGLLWHPELTCKENEALKEHEDKDIYILAKKQQWRRCPACKMIVEKNEGCNHMTCRCGYQFCWLCGKIYGSAGCGGNCGQWIQDTSVVTLPTPSHDADRDGPSTVHDTTIAG